MIPAARPLLPLSLLLTVRGGRPWDRLLTPVAPLHVAHCGQRTPPRPFHAPIIADLAVLKREGGTSMGAPVDTCGPASRLALWTAHPDTATH